jgi:NADH:ubiquinone reductase (H+-translocating)
VQLGAVVVDVDEYGIDVKDADGSARRFESRTKVWAAGVAASPLAKHLANQAGLKVDRAGRVPVRDDCSLPGFPEVFVIGDMMDAGVPGVAQVATQSGKHAAKVIAARAAGREICEPFKYVDKGSMVTILPFAAVASVGRFRFSGFIAWLIWLVIHLLYLIGFKQRVTTLLHWTISFVGRGRAEGAITRQQVVARRALDTLTPAQSGRPDRARLPRR